MINRPPANKIPYGADWLTHMPQGQDWKPPDNPAQPIVEVHFRQAPGRDGTQQQVVEYLYAAIRKQHLNGGTETNKAVQDWVKNIVGVPITVNGKFDDAGHIIGKNQGGLGTVKWNIFPQLPNMNRGSYAQAERIMYDAANASNTIMVPIWFRFLYDDAAYQCRPTSFDFFTIIPGTPGVPPGEIIMHDNIINPTK